MVVFPAGVTVIPLLEHHIQNVSGICPAQKVQGLELLKHELSKGLGYVKLCLHFPLCVFGVMHVHRSKCMNSVNLVKCVSSWMIRVKF
jgi:hypothetical protein